MAIGGGMVLLATGVYAQKAETEMRYDRDKDHSDRELSEPKMAYDRNEFTIDFFAGYTLGESTIKHLNRRNVDRGNWGGGIGVNYFFTRYVGIGADAYIAEDFHDEFIDYASTSLIFRWPIANNNCGLAPYVFAGGGHEFDPIDQNSWHAGGGLEFRCGKNFGIFTDARFIWQHRTDDIGLARLGVRLAF